MSRVLRKGFELYQSTVNVQSWVVCKSIDFHHNHFADHCINLGGNCQGEHSKGWFSVEIAICSSHLVQSALSYCINTHNQIWPVYLPWSPCPQRWHKLPVGPPQTFYYSYKISDDNYSIKSMLHMQQSHTLLTVFLWRKQQTYRYPFFEGSLGWTSLRYYTATRRKWNTWKNCFKHHKQNKVILR